MKFKMFTLAVAMATFSACGGDDETTVGGSCNFAGTSLCSDYPSSLLSAQLDALETVCGAASGVWSTSACTTTNLVGKCAITTDGITSTTNYYSTLFDATTAQSSCTASSGTFTNP
jgi:hypothetical protein